jgi:hypothetical protein
MRKSPRTRGSDQRESRLKFIPTFLPVQCGRGCGPRGLSLAQTSLKVRVPCASRTELWDEESTLESRNSNRNSPELEFALTHSKHMIGARSNRNKTGVPPAQFQRFRHLPEPSLIGVFGGRVLPWCNGIVPPGIGDEVNGYDVG